MDWAATYADFAHRLRFDDLPGEIVDTTKRLILDQLGVMLVGSSAAGVDKLIEAGRAWGGAGEATVLVHGARMPAHHAALVNGTMARAHDFDAFHESALVHITAGSLPQCLAVAEQRGGASGKELILAMVLGMEMMARLGLSFETSFLLTGRVTTLHQATFGGALAAAKLLDLPPREIVSALGLAYGQVAGNLQVAVEGTVLVRVLQGFAAQTAVMSAVLAARGLQGPERVFEGEFGYFKSYHDNKYRAGVLTHDLGRTYEMGNTSIKYYPCCFLAHNAIQATRQLAASASFAAEDVEAIDVGVTQGTFNVVCQPLEKKRVPQTTQEALFSLPYTVANAAVHGTLGLAHMTGEAIRDPRVGALARKVTAAVDPELERDYGRVIGPSIVEMALKDGRRLRARADNVKGHPSNPMSWDDCERKFWDCVPFAATTLDRGRLEEAVAKVRRLENVEDVAVIVRLLAQTGA